MTDILESDLSLLTAMKEAKEEQLKRREREMRKHIPKQSTQPLTPVADDPNAGIGYMNPIPNIN